MKLFQSSHKKIHKQEQSSIENKKREEKFPGKKLTEKKIPY